jgi:alpha-N-arabinofuranosidase
LSSRPISKITNGPDLSWNGFGTDEALTLADRAGAQLMITVNVGTGTPEEAAAWVRYVNGKGTRVRDWELGNELYARTLSADAANVTMRPEVYAAKVKQFARAMREADPNIRIGAIGGESSGPLPLVEYKDWNRIVLQNAGSEIDFLAVHNSYAPVMAFDRDEDLETVYRAMLAAPAGIRQSLNRIAADIAAYAPAEARSRIKIAVTEWGPLFHFSPLSRFVDHSKTLSSALFTASTLMVFIEHTQVDAAQFFKLIDNSFSGLVGQRNADWQETAPFYALQMFRRHFGTRLVQTSVASPEFRTEASGILPATEGNPYLHAVSSLSSDGTTLHVMVVNKNLTEDAVVDLQMAGLRPGTQATVRTLRGSGIDAHTGTQLPFPDQIPWAAQARAKTNSRFDAGAPGEVSVVTSSHSGIAHEFRYRFPAASMTALEIPLLPRH